MSTKEINLPDYIEHKYNRFLMTRVEYLIFTQDEQEAKVLRIIEYCIEMERARLYRDAKAGTPAGQKVEIPEIVWVPISHRFITDHLHGTVQSKTTVRDALTNLETKHLIFRAPGGSGPYDPPLYTINKHLMRQLTQLLPPSLDDLDMGAIMKKPRVSKKPRGVQKLTPSKIDPLVEQIRGAIFAPPDPQFLYLYQSKIVPLSSTGGVQKLYPNIYKDNEDSKKGDMNEADASYQSPPPSFVADGNVAIATRSHLLVVPPVDEVPSPDAPSLPFGGGITEQDVAYFLEKMPVFAAWYEACQQYQSSQEGRVQPGERPRLVYSSNEHVDNDEIEQVSSLHNALASKSDGSKEETGESTGSHENDVSRPPQPQSGALQTGGTNQPDGQNSGRPVKVMTNSPSQASKRSYSRGTTAAHKGQGAAASQKAGRRLATAPKPDLTPIPTPARPDPSAPWTPEKMLAWGDYLRGAALPYSEDPESHYQKAIWGVRVLFGRKVTEGNFLVVGVNWMKGIDLDFKPLPDGALKSPTWPAYTVDLWTIAKHYQVEASRYLEAKEAREKNIAGGNTSSSALPTRQPENTLPAPPEDWEKQYEAQKATRRERTQKGKKS